MRPGSLLEVMVDRIDRIDVGEEDLTAAGVLIGDALACIFGAQASPAAAPLLRWGRHREGSAQSLALVLAGLSSVLEMDAMHVPSSVHLGAVVVPAALAAAVSAGSSGLSLARAVLRGSEAAIRIGRSTGTRHRSRYQSTSTCGPVGAALACADLFGLSSGEAVDAMGHVGSTAGGLWAFLEEDTLTKQWHCGNAASDALVAAQLAGAGLRGPRRLFDSSRGFHAILCEGSAPEELTSGRSGWQLHDTSYKPWPSPRPTHAAITAALDLHPAVAGRDIERVELKTFGMAVDLCNHQPVETAHDARFSLAHCVAVALSQGSVAFESFEVAEIRRQAGLVQRTRVVEDAAMTAAYPERSQASVEVLLADGQMLAGHVDYALGDPQRPLSEGQLRSKHAKLLALTSVADGETLLSTISTLHRSSDSIGDTLARGLQPSGIEIRGVCR